MTTTETQSFVDDLVRVIWALCGAIVTAAACIAFVLYEARSSQPDGISSQQRSYPARRRVRSRPQPQQPQKMPGQISPNNNLGRGGVYSWGLDPWSYVRGPLVPKEHRLTNDPNDVP